MEYNLPVNVREYQDLAKKALPKMHYESMITSKGAQRMSTR
jgi:hypothetical protein